MDCQRTEGSKVDPGRLLQLQLPDSRRHVLATHIAKCFCGLAICVAYNCAKEASSLSIFQARDGAHYRQTPSLGIHLYERRKDFRSALCNAAELVSLLAQAPNPPPVGP